MTEAAATALLALHESSKALHLAYDAMVHLGDADAAHCIRDLGAETAEIIVQISKAHGVPINPPGVET